MGSQQAELGRRLAGRMNLPMQKTAAGTSLAGHDFRQRKSGKARRTGCPDARSFPISIRRGQKSSICEPSRGGRKDGGTCRARFPRSEKTTSSYLRITPHISTFFVHGAPIFEKKGSADRRGSGWRRTGAGPGWRQRTRTRPVLAGRELGRDRLGYAQTIDGGAHDATCVTRTFAARINASGRLLVRSGRIACQSRLEVLPANHSDGA